MGSNRLAREIALSVEGTTAPVRTAGVAELVQPAPRKLVIRVSSRKTSMVAVVEEGAVPA
jgi:hypothetical protein